MNRFLNYYTKAVNHPNVSGFEHLEMLMVRDKLADIEHTLLPVEKDQLEQADRRLAEQASEFHAQLAPITDLQYERDQRQVPPSHWWWYLDVLIQAPSLSARGPEPTLVPS
jgi:hypothetical protein